MIKSVLLTLQILISMRVEAPTFQPQGVWASSKSFVLKKEIKRYGFEFRCGGRALADYTHKNDVIGELSSFLTTGSSDLKPAVEKMQSELKAARKQLKKQQSQLLELEAEKLIQDASTQAGIKLIKKVFSETDLNRAKKSGYPIDQRTRPSRLLRIKRISISTCL